MPDTRVPGHRPEGCRREQRTSERSSMTCCCSSTCSRRNSISCSSRVRLRSFREVCRFRDACADSFSFCSGREKESRGGARPVTAKDPLCTSGRRVWARETRHGRTTATSSLSGRRARRHQNQARGSGGRCRLRRGAGGASKAGQEAGRGEGPRAGLTHACLAPPGAGEKALVSEPRSQPWNRG